MNKFLKFVAVVSTVVLAWSATSYADSVGVTIDSTDDVVITDPDDLTKTVTALNLGTVCSGVDGSDTVDVAVVQTSSSPAYSDNATVTVTAVADTGLSATGGNITLPPNWNEQGNGTKSAAVTSTVKVNTTTSGTYTGKVVYTATEGTKTKSATLWVTASITTEGCGGGGGEEVTNTAPELTLPTSMTVEGNTTGGADVTYTGISASDDEDGDLTSAVVCNPASGSFFALGGPHNVECSVEDSGELSDTGSFTVTVVDTTPPTLSNVPTDKTATATGVSGATVTYTNPTATDTVDSAPTVTCIPASGSTFAPGTTTVSCTGKDASNNTSAASTFDVTVTFNFVGFLQPVDNKIANSMKAGSTAPVKWQITVPGGGYVQGVEGVVASTSGVRRNCTTGTVDSLEQYATGQTSLRYDYTSNQYVYNWQSPRTPGACYQVVIVLTDGTIHTADFTLR